LKRFPIPAILFGGDSINALGVLRNLGRNGVAVYYVADQKDEAVFSRYCKRSFVIPNIERDRKILMTFLTNFEKKIGSSAVIFSGSDMFCLGLSSLENEMSRGYHVLLPKSDVVETLVNKRKFYQSLAEHDIPHPVTYFPESIDDIEAISKEAGYPVYVRPSISQVFSEIFRKKGFVARSREELLKYFTLATRYKIDVLVQEIVPGPATNMFGINGYFDKNGDPRGLFAYRRLREWPRGFGNGSLIESIPVCSLSSIKTSAVEYLHNLRYHGLMDAEFKRDSRDGQFKFLEVNARSWWQNSFPTKCGINLVFAAYLDALGEELDYDEDYVAGLRWSYFLNDTRSVIPMLKTGEITVGAWLSSLRMVDDWAYFSIDDLIPWILNSQYTLNKLVKVNVRRNDSIT
jgi:predicted ATP-grasp superfamily ATP-dependent carboligase